MVRNSIFSNNLYGIQSKSTGVQVAHSNFWQNTFDLDGNLVDVRATRRWIPSTSARATFTCSTSRCIDAGGVLDAPDHDLGGTARPSEGNGEPDADGSNYDMGPTSSTPIEWTG